MRQRRERSIRHPIKLIFLLLAIGIAAAAGLWFAGYVQWNPNKTLDSFMVWNKRDSGVPVFAKANVNGNEAAAASSGKTGTAAAANTAAQPAAPSKPAAENQAGQRLSQVQSLVAVSATERAWLELAGTIKLEPGKLFSYNTWFKEALKAKTMEKKEAELSHMAGLLYEAALRSGLKIGERRAHSELPSYAESGFDVDYQPDLNDLTFYNPFDFVITAAVEYSGDIPILILKGTPSATWKAPKITVNKETFAQEKVVLTDYALAGKGEIKRSDGAAGLLVKVYADWKSDGKDELLYKDYYAPRPVVIALPPTAEDIKATVFR